MSIIKIIKAPEGLNAFYDSSYHDKNDIGYQYTDVSHLAIVEEEVDDGVVFSVRGILDSESGKNNGCDGLMFADAYPDFAYMGYSEDDEFQKQIENTVDILVRCSNNTISRETFFKAINKINDALISANENLKHYAKISGKSIEEFKSSWEDDMLDTFVSFICGLSTIEKNEDVKPAKSNYALINDFVETVVSMLKQCPTIQENTSISNIINQYTTAKQEFDKVLNDVQKDKNESKSKNDTLNKECDEIFLNLYKSFYEITKAQMEHSKKFMELL